MSNVEPDPYWIEVMDRQITRYTGKNYEEFYVDVKQGVVRPFSGNANVDYLAMRVYFGE